MGKSGEKLPWQSDYKPRSFVSDAKCFNKSVVELSNFFAKRQTKPSSFVLILGIKAGKGVKDFFCKLLFEANAVIFKDQPYLVGIIRHLLANGDHRSNIIAGKLQRVINQIIKQLVQQYSCALYNRKCLVLDSGLLFTDYYLQIRFNLTKDFREVYAAWLLA